MLSPAIAEKWLQVGPRPACGQGQVAGAMALMISVNIPVRTTPAIMVPAMESSGFIVVSC